MQFVLQFSGKSIVLFPCARVSVIGILFGHLNVVLQNNDIELVLMLVDGISDKSLNLVSTEIIPNANFLSWVIRELLCA